MRTHNMFASALVCLLYDSYVSCCVYIHIYIYICVYIYIYIYIVVYCLSAMDDSRGLNGLRSEQPTALPKAHAFKLPDRDTYRCYYYYHYHYLQYCYYQEGAGSVRFVSVPDFSKFIGLVRFGSVRLGSVRTIWFPGSTRAGLRFSDTSWLGLVRFGSVPRPVPAGSRMKRFGSVRFCSAGSVRFLLPPCIMISTTSIKWSLRCMAYVHIKRLWCIAEVILHADM